MATRNNEGNFHNVALLHIFRDKEQNYVDFRKLFKRTQNPKISYIIN